MKLFHNGMSVCAQKVRLALAEKRLGYDSVILDLQKGDQFDPDYIKLNPGKVVPTLEDGGFHYCESSLINEYLDDAYPDPALKPSSARQRFLMRTLVRKIDEIVHPACGVITYAVALRTLMLKKSAEELEVMTSQIPDPVRRENRRQVLARGVQAEPFLPALQGYLGVLQKADEQLQDSPWCAGEGFSLADCAVLPYVLRLDHLQLLALLEPMPALLRWYGAMQARPGYEEAITRQLPQPALDLFARCGNAVQAEVLSQFSRQ